MGKCPHRGHVSQPCSTLGVCRSRSWNSVRLPARLAPSKAVHAAPGQASVWAHGGRHPHPDSCAAPFWGLCEVTAVFLTHFLPLALLCVQGNSPEVTRRGVSRQRPHNEGYHDRGHTTGSITEGRRRFLMNRH